MEELKHAPKCTNKVIETQESGKSMIAYCLVCGRFFIDLIPCNHTWKHILLILSNKAKQLRKYCTNCYVLTPNGEKQDGHDLSKILTKSYEEYTNGYNELRRKDESKFTELVQDLKDIQHKFNQGDYGEYLNSEHWKSLSARIMKRDKYTCQICGQPAKDVHHMEYCHLGAEYDFELVSLCRNCHEIEYKQ